MRKITLYPAPDCATPASKITIWDAGQNTYLALIDALADDLETAADRLHCIECFWGGAFDEDHTAEIIYERAPTDGHREIIGSIDRQLTADEWREVRRVFPREFARAA